MVGQKFANFIINIPFSDLGGRL